MNLAALIRYTVAVALVCASAAMTPAAAQSPGRLGHFVTADGLTGFVLDRSGAKPLLRVDGSPEILVLTVAQAPGEATAFKLDTGATILRIGASGGITFFDDPHRDGTGLSRDADAQPLRPPMTSRARALARAEEIGRDMAARVGAPVAVSIEAPQARDDDVAWGALLDGLEVAAIAVEHVARNELGRSALARGLARVRILPSDPPAAVLADATLTIHCNLGMGLEGRPSSAAVRKVIEESL